MEHLRDENRILRTNLDGSNNLISKLQKDMNELKPVESRLEFDYNAILEEKSKLEREIQSLNEKNAELVNEKKKLEEKIQSLKEKNEELDEECESLSKDYQERDLRVTNLENELFDKGMHFFCLVKVFQQVRFFFFVAGQMIIEYDRRLKEFDDISQRLQKAAKENEDLKKNMINLDDSKNTVASSVDEINLKRQNRRSNQFNMHRNLDQESIIDDECSCQILRKRIHDLEIEIVQRNSFIASLQLQMECDNAPYKARLREKEELVKVYQDKVRQMLICEKYVCVFDYICGFNHCRLGSRKATFENWSTS